MPRTLRAIAIIELIAGLVLAIWWFRVSEGFLGLAFLLSGLISAIVFLALAQILENSNLMRQDLGSLRDELRRESSTARGHAGAGFSIVIAAAVNGGDQRIGRSGHRSNHIHLQRREL
ncbi:hypothetical protein QFZ27_002419 [Inquilinus ginsengisoli]|uniref:hypothetical protein n=1 Tax=Inquilinus ginsengisoli TaxID=363840 RepID=UPI003D1F0792